jgi:hypothetical protein
MATYKMPPVEPGMLVLWHDGGDAQATPAPAIVCTVGERTVALQIVAPLSHNLLFKDGVRHASDPDRRAIDQAEAGAWRHTPFTQALLEALGQKPRHGK